MNETQLSATKRALLEKYLQGNLTGAEKEVETIQPRVQGTPAPLSFGQQRMWLLAQMIPDTPVYNESITLRFPEVLNTGALERSFNEVIRRHEVWRSSFPVINEEPVQIVHPVLTLKFPVVDLRNLPEPEREPEAIRLATEQALPLFDLSQIPLIRATLIRISDDDYRLYVTLHHILFDGSIYNIFLPELLAHYEAFVADKPSPLAPLPLQYSDFAVWQREHLQTKEVTDQMDYWRQQLAGAPASLEIPIDRPRSVIESHRGARLPFALSPQLVKDLKALGHREGITFYTVLVASFNALLYRYSGQEDIILGTTVGGKSRKEVQDMLGLFLNSLILRTDLSHNPTFRELLMRVRNVVLEAHMHQDIPLEYLVKELQQERRPGQSPFIQVMLSLEPPLPTLASGWTITQSDVDINTAKLDLYLELDDRPEDFVAWLEYNADLFDEATALRMIGHWQTILHSIVIDPTQRLADLPILTANEEQQILTTWNATTREYPPNCCIHQLFEDQVQRTPEAIAVVFEDQQLSYRELNAQANQLAHYLQKQGVGPEIPIGLYLERSLDMLIALLGVLKTGSAYIPLDPAYPQDRIAFVLQDSQAPLLLTQQKVLETLSCDRPMAICLDTDWSLIAQESKTNLKSAVSPNNLAYIIYTSGSSGRPKGVQLQHSGVVNFLSSMQRDFHITTQDSLLAVTTLSFDIAVLEIFLPLITGARLHMLSQETTTNGDELGRALSVFHPTMMQATPATWNMLLDTGMPTIHHLTILCTGEAMPHHLLEQLMAKKPAAIWNLYGPTETTIWSSTQKMTSASLPITIGRPIANTQMYIVDAAGKPVPVGIPGELLIGGAGLARGYLHQPELTAEKFVPNPFSDDPASRLYRTGDLVRYLPDGTIDYLHRIDQQVKIRGFRIELAEIETILRQHPAVRGAAVIMHEDAQAGKQLIAYIVTSQKSSLTTKILTEALREKLPDYMMPSAFMQLDALPLTPNGKLDRKALSGTHSTTITTGASTVLPTTMIQYQLLQIWEELLNKRSISMQDNFFLLGGHSLLATRLIIKIEQAFDRKITLPTLFAGPTIDQLAHALQKDGQSVLRPNIIGIQTNGTQRPFFFLHGDYKGGPAYCYALMRILGKDQPFYVLEPYQFNEQQNTPTIETMAEAQLKSIRSIQPHGPYSLGGFCNGALVAYEMARQLDAQGEQTDMLIIIDAAYPPLSHKLVQKTLHRIGKRLKIDQEKQLAWFLSLRHAYKYLRKQRTAEDLEELITTDPSLYTLRPKVDTLFLDNIAIFNWTIAAYNYSNPYRGKVILLQCKEEPLSGVWKRKILQVENNIEVHSVPGSHISCRTDYVQELGEELKHQLNRRRYASAQSA